MNVRNTLVAVAAMVGLCLTGCGDSGTPASSTSTASTTPTNPSGNSVATVVDGAGTQPAQSVAIFLDSLRSGDEEAANGVLTTKAREELAKTPYEMQPLGTPEGKFEIGRVGYPYDDKSVALVECQWTEPPLPGEDPLRMDIVCEVHKETAGWRISGLVATVPESEETLVLDFEDAASLQATLDSATRSTMPAEQASVPANTSGVPAQTVAGPTGLPPASQYPALPTQEAPASSGSGDLPPLPNYPQ